MPVPVQHSATAEQYNPTWIVPLRLDRAVALEGQGYRLHSPTTPLAVLVQCNRVQKTSILGPLLVVVRAQVNLITSSNNSSNHYHKEQEET